jgi:hypothetical protein
MRFEVKRQTLRISRGAALLAFGALGIAAFTVHGQTYVFGTADFATGNAPVALALGDFNGDGKLDLAVANQSDSTVSILLGQPDGTFGPKKDYAVRTSPSSVAVADFNLDGKLDWRSLTTLTTLCRFCSATAMAPSKRWRVMIRALAPPPWRSATSMGTISPTWR